MAIAKIAVDRHRSAPSVVSKGECVSYPGGQPNGGAIMPIPTGHGPVVFLDETVEEELASAMFGVLNPDLSWNEVAPGSPVDLHCRALAKGAIAVLQDRSRILTVDVSGRGSSALEGHQASP